jgi:hypothetical protein
MSTSTPTRSTPDTNGASRADGSARRRSTETKASFKTTEFFAYLAAVVGVLVAAGVVDETNAGGFGARQAWLYVTILTVGYMVSRGFAKSGSREPYTSDDRS